MCKTLKTEKYCTKLKYIFFKNIISLCFYKFTESKNWAICKDCHLRKIDTLF